MNRVSVARVAASLALVAGTALARAPAWAFVGAVGMARPMSMAPSMIALTPALHGGVRVSQTGNGAELSKSGQLVFGSLVAAEVLLPLALFGAFAWRFRLSLDEEIERDVEKNRRADEKKLKKELAAFGKQQPKLTRAAERAAEVLGALGVLSITRTLALNALADASAEAMKSGASEEHCCAVAIRPLMKASLAGDKTVFADFNAAVGQRMGNPSADLRLEMIDAAHLLCNDMFSARRKSIGVDEIVKQVLERGDDFSFLAMTSNSGKPARI